MNRLRMARLLCLLLSAAALTACGSAAKWDTTRPSRGPQSAFPDPIRPPEANPGQYTVKPGDTLYSIAFRYRLKFQDVARWNQIGESYLIRPGQVLRLTPPPVVAQNTPRGTTGGSRTTPTRPTTRPRQGSATPQTRRPSASTSSPQTTPARRTGPVQWRWPVAGAVAKPFTEARQGIVLAGKSGDGIRAASAGEVVYSGTGLQGYGKLVIVKHSETYLSAYGYNSAVLVEEGAQVSAGQQIARMGLGPGGTPALRFEIRREGRPINPVSQLPQR